MHEDTWHGCCRKKIGPLQWDLSVAEHLQPGESYKEVASLCHPYITLQRPLGSASGIAQGLMPCQYADPVLLGNVNMPSMVRLKRHTW